MRNLTAFLTLLAFLANSLAWGLTTPDCSRTAGSVPSPMSMPIEHVIVVMQENHSFDSYFGQLNQPQFYGSQIDGLNPKLSNPDNTGSLVFPFHSANLCPKSPRHQWNYMHGDWNGGANDGFVLNNQPWIMGYYDQTDLPFYYSLANTFATSDRYFAPILASTIPNRLYLFAGTSFGHIHNDHPGSLGQWSQKTIFDVMNENGVSWKYYRNNLAYLLLFMPLYRKNLAKIKKISEFQKDLKGGTLPQVVFIDSEADREDEHPSTNLQIGQQWVSDRFQDILSSQYWKNSVIFFTYDEGGGFYDHVAPPQACAPDDIPPNLAKDDVSAPFDQRGFRVPFVAVSPYAKRHYVSHGIYDHTSILKFIETKFNLPALTRRDANADAMMDLFDFNRPDFTLPRLSKVDLRGGKKCDGPSDVDGLTK